MKLITETTEDVAYITEAKEDGKKNHFIEGIFMQADVQNRNGRLYPLHVLENETNRYTREMINSGRSYGELGHPAGPTINLDRVSHIVTELRKEGSNFYGKAKLTETPMGNIARGLLDSGGRFGVSSRGLGSLKEENGVMKVQSDFRLATPGDIVHDPSAPRAFVDGIMEGVEYWYDAATNEWKEEYIDDVKKTIHKLSKSQLEERMLNMFESFMEEMVRK